MSDYNSQFTGSQIDEAVSKIIKNSINFSSMGLTELVVDEENDLHIITSEQFEQLAQLSKNGPIKTSISVNNGLITINFEAVLNGWYTESYPPGGKTVEFYGIGYIEPDYGVDIAIKAVNNATEYYLTGFAKTISSGTGDGNTQSDWNQNDPEQPDYIKNRPFYSEQVEATLIDQMFDDFVPFNDIPGTFASSTAANLIELKAGNNYNVFWNDSEYNVIAKLLSDSAPVAYIGNLGMFGIGENTGEPFVMIDKSGGLPLLTTDSESSHYIKLVEISTQYNKLDQKFIPNSGVGVVGGIEVIRWTSMNVSLSEVEYAADKLKNNGACVYWDVYGNSTSSGIRIFDISISEDKSVVCLLTSGSVSFDLENIATSNLNLCLKYTVERNSINFERYSYIDSTDTYINSISSKYVNIKPEGYINLDLTSDIGKGGKSVILPNYSSNNNNQFLQIADGVPTWVSLPVYNGEVE